MTICTSILLYLFKKHTSKNTTAPDALLLAFRPLGFLYQRAEQQRTR